MASLYERVGGHNALVQIVDSGYNKMKTHPVMGRTFDKFASSPQTFQKLKDKTVEFLGGEWGGPPYQGPDLYISHATMNIEVKVYDVLLDMFGECFQDAGLDESTSSECMESIRRMREPICDPDGIFAREFDERMEALSRAREERTAFYKKFNIKYSKLTFLSADPRYHEVPKGWRKNGFKLDATDAHEAKPQDDARAQGDAFSASKGSNEKKTSAKSKPKSKAAAKTLASPAEAQPADVEPAMAPLAQSELATKSGKSQGAETRESSETAKVEQECDCVESATKGIPKKQIRFEEPLATLIHVDITALPACDNEDEDTTPNLNSLDANSTSHAFGGLFSCSACVARECGDDTEAEPVRRDV
eukprot:TRINITY_DN28003_c0_g1_i1.p1 TRINITY_DN28003_c0_g1~~TRINITY_DN28003_c0_g1_i1.p1  ORF type:complete len:362 (+),score=58.28 TRINITY_DN28003_c0_g1_i1:31-1116(+)